MNNLHTYALCIYPKSSISPQDYKEVFGIYGTRFSLLSYIYSALLFVRLPLHISFTAASHNQIVIVQSFTAFK